MLNGVAPFVDDLGADFFAIRGRDRVMLMFKAILREVPVHRELANTCDGLSAFEIGRSVAPVSD